ncbi:hypothetical protein C1X35_01815 [Pseudomonas sp. FW306-1C-G01A]|nr:hypothetical protein C1X56_00595 [Pseudomonas sp. GW101-1A09]PMV96614.1 hypothetical protein C1X51_07400 [Pseudomonas sp. FW306-2-2C-B10A]PMV99227.1 hypothetical protein C1X55_12830 [Pseudomonas sp. GW460-C8]PMW07142.1 hypothetical protein C1X50_05540 [Pseudomonas sp. MPR-TSA4]PMW19470.1 hypothetical protein C1X52_07275 [Pseudomonas sp. FW306-2-1A-C05A]PMW23838.1 hypothetical protein C1X40_05835 [Pseudomonas sp. GW456-11-11-14-TSB2]PMW25091.1 hypothetical protein C1X53_07925 [Pseudomonas s
MRGLGKCIGDEKPAVLCRLVASAGLCSQQDPLWRGSLLPLGCEAAPKRLAERDSQIMPDGLTAASRSSGSKLPRHKVVIASA